MKTIRILIVVMAFVSLSASTFAQEKYAVLITGDYAAQGIPLEDQWNHGQGRSAYGYEEFWYDTYLMWEMLVYEKGYSDENVFVLFAGGQDFTKPNMWSRYTAAAHGLYHITDFSATNSNVNDVFNGLANGSGGFPQVTEDDFLFVWTFDHGGPGPGQTGPVYLCLLNNTHMWDYEFAALTDQIPAYKKVFWMQQCRSGGFYDDLEAMNTVFNSACQPLEYAYPADNVDINDNPVDEWEQVNGEYYRHGEFDFHNYSASVGESPAFVNNYNGQPYSEADENNDYYISVLESYNWEETHESIDVGGIYPGEDPLYSDLGNIGGNTSLVYPTLLHTDVTTNINYRGLIGISKDIHVTTGKQLTFNNNADIYLLNNAKLIVDPGANLIIEDDVMFLGNNNSSIQINGNIQIGQGVTFDIGNLILNNQNATVTFNNVSFNNGQLINYCEALDIENSTISYTYIGSHRGFVNLENSTFDHVWTYFTNTVNPKPFYSLSITDCIFKNEAHPGINIDEYGWYYINNNQIYNCNGGGISLFNSGHGPSGNQNILFNDIYNNASSGISIYNSTASVSGNYIHDNQFGVKFFNNSRVAFYGNPNASSYDEMNLVMDNSSYEVYSSGYSFPWYFRYNAIIDEDNLGNPTDPMVYYQWASGDPIPKDIRYNCWGNNFDYHEDLYPDVYLVNPIWCPGGDNQHVPDAAEDMHTSAVGQFEAGNYTDAKNLFEMLIQQYPESEYAQSAMKELFRLEQLVSNDYNGLKQYYRTNDTILADTALTKLGDFLANKCDVKLENWQTAIDWYENIIQNPETMEDSIFAIIDLGYTYFLMENSGSRYSYTGTMPEHKPKSMSEFRIKRDELLALLPGSNQFETPKQNLENLKPGELMQNVPNPFSTSTSIYYRISEPGNVVIRVYDCLGKEQNSIRQLDMNEGIHKIELNVTELPVGIYYYSLEINGKMTSTKKMVIMK
ncbi:MAG: right-handed parallel beta-helix repeat-containing protein [Bacteroidetes bacterium]|nr:right-handed parallel beta-helix repeat-containing protein [Bacteroidota bacterium]